MDSMPSFNIYLLFSILAGGFLSANSIAQNAPQASSLSSEVTYVDGMEKRNLNPTSSENDAKELANSIEFEVYKLTDSGMSQAVYESPAGICHGFKNTQHGVSYTNSTHHYVYPENKREYYGSVTGAKIYQHRDASNVSYVPVYSISDNNLSKKIQSRENKNIKEKVTNHINEGRHLLNDVVCY